MTAPGPTLHRDLMSEAIPRQLSLFDDPTFFESADVELKSAKGGLPASFWETYSAFANTDGGTIYLGVAERPGSALDVHGVADPDRMQSDLWSAANNRGKVNCNVMRREDVAVYELNGAKLLRVVVRRATRHERPVFLNNDPMGQTYRRDHSGDYRCSGDEVRRMFADQSQEPADSRILSHFGLDDIHKPSLQQYRNRMSAASPAHPWLLENDQDFLTKLGGWRRDRATGRDGLTVAGLLMFGLRDAIVAPEALPQFHLDYRERLGDDTDQRWTDRVTVDGTWEGNLFQFYNRVMPRAAATLKAPFQLDSTLYRYDESSVAAALREAVVNALIHGDFTGQGGVIIDRFADVIELSNPGTLLISHEQLLRGGVSECRNKSLQLMFQMMGAGDKAGSGLDKIRSSWEDARFRSPRMQETQRPDRVRLILPMVSLLPEESISTLRARFGPMWDELRPEEIQILVIALEEGGVTNLRLQEVLTLHRTDVTKVLQHLVKACYLLRAGFGRWTKYELPAVSEGLTSARPHDGTLDGSSDSDGTLDGTPDGTSGRPLGYRVGLQASDPELWAKLLEIAGAARLGQVVPTDDLQSIILELCRQAEWLTREELGRLLSRSSTNLRDRVLNPMVASGLLSLRHESKNHPQQAYTAKL